MKSFIENAWQHGHVLMWLLWPLKLIYAGITALRRLMYRLGIKRKVVLDVPVIVVGNLTVGGNGKTPVVVWLTKLLQQQGYNVGIISRGYGGENQGEMLVDNHSDPRLCGDEPKLIVNQTNALMAVGRDRVATGQLLIAHGIDLDRPIDIIISDDGLQHYRLARQMEVVVIDGARRFGNNHLLPMGPMREGQWRAKDATLVINNGGACAFNEELMTLEPSAWRYVESNSEFDKVLLAQKEVVAMAGIGYPSRFFDTLATQKIPLTATKAFNDHQPYNQDMLAPLVRHDQWLVMTEKDAVKCQSFAQDNWLYVPVTAKLTLAAQQKILDRLKEIL